MTILELMDDAYATAKEKGWTDDNRTVGDHIALMHSELSEALEWYRKGIPITEILGQDEGKPDGFPLDLADVIIRIAQFATEKGIDLEKAIRLKLAYNKTRSYRHGGKVI